MARQNHDEQPAPRSLQEWMERTQTNASRLLTILRAKTGKTISPMMMSYILRGSRRCSLVNAMALHAVTKVPIDTLMQWPKVSELDKSYGRRSKSAA